MNFINNARHMKLSVNGRRMAAAFDDKALETIREFFIAFALVSEEGVVKDTWRWR